MKSDYFQNKVFVFQPYIYSVSWPGVMDDFASAYLCCGSPSNHMHMERTHTKTTQAKRPIKLAIGKRDNEFCLFSGPAMGINSHFITNVPKTDTIFASMNVTKWCKVFSVVVEFQGKNGPDSFLWSCNSVIVHTDLPLHSCSKTGIMTLPLKMWFSLSWFHLAFWLVLLILSTHYTVILGCNVCIVNFISSVFTILRSNEHLFPNE